MATPIFTLVWWCAMSRLNGVVTMTSNTTKRFNFIRAASLALLLVFGAPVLVLCLPALVVLLGLVCAGVGFICLCWLGYMMLRPFYVVAKLAMLVSWRCMKVLMWPAWLVAKWSAYCFYQTAWLGIFVAAFCWPHVKRCFANTANKATQDVVECSPTPTKQAAASVKSVTSQPRRPTAVKVTRGPSNTPYCVAKTANASVRPASVKGGLRQATTTAAASAAAQEFESGKLSVGSVLASFESAKVVGAQLSALTGGVTTKKEVPASVPATVAAKDSNIEASKSACVGARMSLLPPQRRQATPRVSNDTIGSMTGGVSAGVRVVSLLLALRWAVSLSQVAKSVSVGSKVSGCSNDANTPNQQAMCSAAAARVALAVASGYGSLWGAAVPVTQQVSSSNNPAKLSPGVCLAGRAVLCCAAGCEAEVPGLLLGAAVVDGPVC